MNHCNTCKHLTPAKLSNASVRPEFLSLEQRATRLEYYLVTDPAKCTWSPEWLKLDKPEEHFCAHWAERDEDSFEPIL